MTFEEALKELKADKKIKRKEWVCYMKIMPENCPDIDMEDILANDWEIIE